MTKQFYKRLEILLNIINKTFENINSGGCGHFGLMLGRKLENTGKKVTVICLQRIINKDDIELIKKVYDFLPDELAELNKNGGYLSHVVIKFEGRYIDNTGIYETKEALYKQYKDFHIMTEASLDKLESWCKTGDWVNIFDVKQLPKISRVLDTYFDKELTIMKRLNIYLDVW